MRKYIFSAMVLVLGLFTVTAVLATKYKLTDEHAINDMHYFDDINYNPETQWHLPAAWGSPTSVGPSCPLPINEPTVCRVHLLPGQDITDFLAIVEGGTYNQLLQNSQIETKELE